MNKGNLIQFAKEYLGVQELPAHIKLLLEGMSSGRGKLIYTGRQFGRTTSHNIAKAYSRNRMENNSSQTRTIPINTINGDHGEK